jgi:RNA polymerase sigma factor (TIGR02999 family)
VALSSGKLAVSQEAGDNRRRGDELLPEVYEELRQRAARYLEWERAGHTLTPTALVHEAYARLAGSGSHWQGKTHFAAVAAVVMRRVLVDQARARRAVKRGAGGRREPLMTSVDLANDRGPEAVDVLALDEALQELEQLNTRHSRLIEMRFFGGLTLSTAEADWRMARTWLRRRLSS